MYKDIKHVFEKHLSHLKYDTSLYIQLKNFRLGWTVKSTEYTEFLGGGLLGVHEVRFSSRDEEELFVNILGVNYGSLKEDILQVKGINPNWKVSSNPTYLTLLYLIHMYITTSKVKDIKDVVDEIYYIYAYKTISSLISHGFKHKLNESIAKAAYERLSNRFILKRVGSWQKVFEHRATDVEPPSGLHVKAIKTLTTNQIILLANDIQGRIRDMFKNIYAVIVEIKNESNTLETTTLNQKDEDGESLKDILNRSDMYVNNILSVINKENDFIKNDILVVISTILPNLDIELLRKTLIYISKKYNDEDYVKHIVIDNINFLSGIGYINNYLDDLVDILYKIKGYWGSSRTSNKHIPMIKKELFKIAKTATNKKTKWMLVNIVIGVVMYIFIRSTLKKTI